MSETSPVAAEPVPDELDPNQADLNPDHNIPIEPFNPDQLDRGLQIQVVDMSQGVHDNARDAAAEYINKKTTEGGFFKRVVKKVWHGNVARDFINLSQQKKARDEITETGNLYVRQAGSQGDHDRAASAVVRRITEGVLHGEEAQKDLTEVERGTNLQQNLKELVTSFADGSIDETQLREERTRLLGEYGRKVRAEDRKKGLLFADNILEVAQNAKAAFNHGVGLDRIDQALKAKHTEAEMGVRSHAKLNAAEKLLNSKGGLLINENVAMVAAATAVTLSKWTTRKVATAAGATLGLGFGAAVIAGAREALHVKQDRVTHMREMAEGGEGSSLHVSGKRRESLEKTRYETVSAQSLTNELTTTSNFDPSDPNGLRAAALAIINARGRIRMSDRDNIDRIHFSGKTNVEAERTELDLTLARARAAVQDAVADATDETLEAAGIDGRDLDAYFDTQTNRLMDGLDGNLEGSLAQDVKVKDKAFGRLRLKRAASMAAVGFITSETMGLAIQEARAAIDDSVQGVFEDQTYDQNQRTLLAGIFRHDGPASTTNESLVAQPHNYVDIGHNVQVDVPHGYNLANHDGHWQLADAHGKVIDSNVGFNHDGSFNSDTQQYLTDKGFHFENASQVVNQPDIINHTTTTVTADQYMAAHPNEFTSVHRELWYDNNTPNVYDHNELGLWWGGQGNVGVDANGNYVMSVAHMSPDGSWHQGVSANAQQLYQNHQMALALSVTQGSQEHVVMVNFDPNGNAVIDKNSFAGQGLFQMQDGHAKFVGAYAEAVQLGTTNPDGSQNMSMLATVVGQGNPNSVTDAVTTYTHNSYTEVTNTLYAPILEANLPTEVAAGTVIYGRGGLEYPKEARNAETPADAPIGGYEYAYRNAYSPESLRRYDQYRSPRLIEDPQARLNLGEELDWWQERVATDPNGGEDYLADIREGVLASSELRSLDATTKAIVCIPVAAASEPDNIYNTLSLYAQQEGDAKQQSKILLHLNWFEDADMDRVNRTITEVDRARQDFPDLDIADIRTEWDRATYSTSGIIYHVVNKLYDTALAAADEAIRNGRAPSDHDLLIIRNDADSQGMARDYLQREVTAAESNPESDAFVSATRQGTASHNAYPGFGVVANMREVIDQTKSLLHKPVSTIGTNTAVRASTLAAIGCIRRDDGYTGAGSDDLEIGNRIYSARMSSYAGAAGGITPTYGSYGTDQTQDSQVSSSRPGRHRRSRVAGARSGYTPTSGETLPDGVGTPIKYVRGAHIDASPDRILNTYRSLQPITEAWGDFDSGGHLDRTAVGAGRIRLNGESTRVIDGVARRVEQNYSAMFNTWAQGDQDVIRVALGLAHGEGEDIYSVSWDENGRCQFKFTDQGREWLKDRLERNGRGQKDRFGNRVRRALYGEVPRFSRRRPASRHTRFVKADDAV